MRVRDLEVRAVNESDLEDLLSVYCQCEDFLALGPHPKASPEMVLLDLGESRKESGSFCGIYEGWKIIGVVDFAPKDFNGEKGVSKISLLMIATPFRRGGVGTRVVEIIEKEIARKHDSEEILVAVQTNNPGAMKFWQKRGYAVFAGPELRPDQTTVYYLRKKAASRE